MSSCSAKFVGNSLNSYGLNLYTSILPLFSYLGMMKAERNKVQDYRVISVWNVQTWTQTRMQTRTRIVTYSIPMGC